jgi:hypothetical protein
VAFAAVGDPYNQPVYQGSAGYTDQLVEQIQLRLARADYYMVRSLARGWQDRPTTANDNGLELRIAGRFGFGARAVNTAKLPIWQNHIPQTVVFYRAPDEEKSIDQSVFQRLGNKSGSAPVILNECNRP